MKVDVILPLSWQRVAFAMGVAIVASMILEPVLGLVLPVSPAIPLAVVCVVAVGNGPLYGVASGFLGGLLLDLVGAGPLGLNMAALALVGFVTGKAERLLPPWAESLRVAVAAPLTALYIPAAVLLSLLAGTPARFGLRVAFFFVLANVACAILLAPVLNAARLRTRRA